MNKYLNLAARAFLTFLGVAVTIFSISFLNYGGSWLWFFITAVTGILIFLYGRKGFSRPTEVKMDDTPNVVKKVSKTFTNALLLFGAFFLFIFATFYFILILATSR
ncbi:MAG: hypothetical protein WAV15_03465 [Minisyncoccia bacterium]